MEGANMLPVIERPSTTHAAGDVRRLHMGRVAAAGSYALVGLGAFASIVGAILVAIYADAVSPPAGLGLAGLAGAVAIGIAVWRLGEARAARTARRKLEKSIEARDTAHLVTDRVGHVAFDNRVARLLFDGLRKDSVVAVTSLSVFERMVAPGSTWSFCPVSLPD